MRTRPLLLLCSCILLVCSSVRAEDPPRYAGATDSGFLLPNGWKLTPAGEHVPLTDLPLNIIPLADSRHALVASSGYNSHELVLVDIESRKKLSTQTVRQSWFGLAVSPAQDEIWWSGGGGNQVHRYALKQLELTRQGPAEAEPLASKIVPVGAHHFISGVTFDARRKQLYVLDVDAGTITARDPAGARKDRMRKIGIRPYDVAVSPNGAQLYVSDWAARSLLVVDPAELRTLSRIAVGEHPNQIAVHPTDGRLFVACASSNSVSVIDTNRGIVTETIKTALFPHAPEGSTPDALAIAPDGETLFVANADNNCVAVIDIERSSQSQVKGFIPTGWYPTSVAVTPDGKRLLVGVGKGNQTHPNPFKKPQPADTPAAEKPGTPAPDRPASTKPTSPVRPYPYIGTTLSGALSIVEIPTDERLAEYTESVYRNCPYSDKLLSAASCTEPTAIPTRVGDASPIKYVIYIIKENRTYDQVFGDLPRGNGDPSLTMFGRQVTPNHHKLAEEFVLLDNLYCNGHVSADGHPWSTMAYNTDYIGRNWALTYSSRAGVDDDDEADLARSPSGYLWDACARQNLTYRSYGEYGSRVSQRDGSVRIEAAVPGLVDHICPQYGLIRGSASAARDTENVETFLAEFREFEKQGNLPRFIVMSLGEDHTTGTKPGAFTPQACVASNDLALGRLVEAVTQSKYWPETAIFVIEDDAQNGPDHVDAHRTVGLVISPYVKRHTLDSTQYSTVSMVRTIELILGLPPLSQYDAAARPMFATFGDKPDLTPFAHEEPKIDLDAKNGTLAYGAERSSRMDFSEYDRIDDFELNEILWRAVKGADAPLPPAVRQAIAQRLVAAPEN